MRIFFAWYDLWVGVYVDRKNKRIYVCPLPCLVLMFQYATHPLTIKNRKVVRHMDNDLLYGCVLTMLDENEAARDTAGEGEC